jgi:hypothetical protein
MLRALDTKKTLGLAENQWWRSTSLFRIVIYSAITFSFHNVAEFLFQYLALSWVNLRFLYTLNKKSSRRGPQPTVLTSVGRRLMIKLLDLAGQGPYPINFPTSKRLRWNIFLLKRSDIESLVKLLFEGTVARACSSPFFPIERPRMVTWFIAWSPFSK